MNTLDLLTLKKPDPQKILHSTAFALSAPTFKLCPPDTALEVAFAGRSNAGKSSCINTLTGQRQLARTSKTPGRTQMINFFAVDKDKYLVDLPGYGYAQVPEAMKLKWQKELEHYLVYRQSLVGLVLLMDIRHPLKEFDTQMLLWAKAGNLPVHILLTKCDKLKSGAKKATLKQVKDALMALKVNASAQLFSSLHKEGVDVLAHQLGDWLKFDEPTDPSTTPQEQTPQEQTPSEQGANND